MTSFIIPDPRKMKRKPAPRQFGLVYLVYCSKTDRVYIGQTRATTARKRWVQHLAQARSGSSMKIHEAIREHGESAFEVSQIASAWRTGDLDELELILIAQYDSEANGYNTMGPNVIAAQKKLMTALSQAVKRVGAEAVISLLEGAQAS